MSHQAGGRSIQGKPTSETEKNRWPDRTKYAYAKPSPIGRLLAGLFSKGPSYINNHIKLFLFLFSQIVSISKWRKNKYLTEAMHLPKLEGLQWFFFLKYSWHSSELNHLALFRTIVASIYEICPILSSYMCILSMKMLPIKEELYKIRASKGSCNIKGRDVFQAEKRKCSFFILQLYFTCLKMSLSSCRFCL